MFSEAKAKDFTPKAKDLVSKAKDMTSCPRGQGHGLEDSISDCIAVYAICTNIGAKTQTQEKPLVFEFHFFV